MTDVTKLSDAELMAALGQPQTAAAPAQQMSDADLMASLRREQEKPGAAETFGRGAANTLTFGLADEAYGAGRGIRSWMRGDGFQEGYNRGVGEYRARDKAAEEANPWTSVGGKVAGAVVPGAAAARLVTAPALMGRVAQSALIGGGMGAAQGFGDAEGGFVDRLRAADQESSLGAVLGAGGEVAATAIGAGLRRAFGGARDAAPGVDPAARVAAADEFGIPLTRGQATGDIAQQSFEEAARHNARGLPAQKVMEGFDAQQQAAVQAARERMAAGIGGQSVPAGTMGEGVQGALRSQADNLRNSAEMAYTVAGAKGATIGLDHVGTLAAKVSDDLASAGIVINPNYGTHGGANSAMNLLRRVAGFEGAPEGAVAQSLEGLDAARKGLSAVKATNPEDARALATIRRSFDGWLDDAIDKRLFSGDPTAIDDLKRARGLWSQYKGLTSAKPGDKAPSVIVKMQQQDVTGEQVANWLLGTSGADQAGRSAAVAGRLKGILGKGSDEWEALRQTAFTKLMEPARGNGGPQAVSKSISDFIDGQGAPLAKQLFSSDEIGQMRRYAAVLRSMVPDPKATNPSKSGYEIARMLGGAGIGAGAVGAGGATSYATGDPRYLAIAALPLFRNASSLSKGIAATRAAPSAIGQALGTAARVPAFSGAALLPPPGQ